MELLTTKIIALTLMGVLSLFFGILPLRLKKYFHHGSRRRDRIVSCLLCFGGGVLLATVFTHMLPETRENFNNAFSRKVLSVGQDYPLAELVTCAGFFLVYFVEEFVQKIFFRRDHHHSRKMTKLAAAIEDETGHTHHHHHHHHNGRHHHHAHNHNHSSPLDGSTGGAELANGKQVTPDDTRQTIYSVSGSDPPRATNGSVVGAAKTRWAESGVDNPVFAGDLDAATWNPHLKEQIINSTQVVPVATSPSNTPLEPVSQHGGHGGHGHSHLGVGKLGAKGLASNLRSLLVILALSFHSVFEGLAVGLQEKQVDVWYLMGAICAHKLVIAFCMGLELLAAGTVVGLVVVYMVVFALVSPLGVAVGIIVTENVSSGDGGHLVAVTILQGLAGGTILYVTFFEVLERERGRGGGQLTKLLFVVLGFGAMAALEAVGGHSHGPAGHGGHGGHVGHGHGVTTPAAIGMEPDHDDHDNHDHHGHDHHDHSHDHDHDH